MDEDLRHPSGGGSRNRPCEVVNPPPPDPAESLSRNARQPGTPRRARVRCDRCGELRAENLCRQCVDEAAARPGWGKS